MDASAAAGLRTGVPPEGWLVKVWDGDTLVDLIFRPTGLDIDEAFAASDLLNVHAVVMPVLSVDDLLITKLLALTEHNLDYAPVLEYARTCASRSTGVRCNDEPPVHRSRARSSRWSRRSVCPSCTHRRLDQGEERAAER